MKKINTIIFDLDGVLVDTKIIHFKSLNLAFDKANVRHQISFEDHLKYFDGLSTREKLSILEKKKIIKKKDIKKIVKFKNYFTNIELKKNVKYNKKIFNIFRKLSKNYKLGIATNAIKKTLDICVKNLKIEKFLKSKISNEEINFTKPNPEIYLRSILILQSIPSQTLIIEDSPVGIEAASESGCNWIRVDSPDSLTLTIISNKIEELKKNNKTHNRSLWKDDKLNVLIPMAGSGQRFKDQGYAFPKPLIEVHGKPMIQWVLESINIDANYIFIVQKEHVTQFNLSSVLKILKPDCKIIEIEKVTEGAACTTLLANKEINNSNPLIITNSDQFYQWNASKCMYNFTSKKVDGGMLTFNSYHPKWSYAKVDQDNYLMEVAEKKVISNNATVGFYYWRKGSDYVKYAEQMIKKNIRVNNEFYVCPVFNEALEDKKKFLISPVEEMWGLGTPEDLNYFLNYSKYSK